MAKVRTVDGKTYDLEEGQTRSEIVVDLLMKIYEELKKKT